MTHSAIRDDADLIVGFVLLVVIATTALIVSAYYQIQDFKRVHYGEPAIVHTLLAGPEIAPRSLAYTDVRSLSRSATTGFVAATTGKYALACVSVPTLRDTSLPFLLTISKSGSIRRSRQIDESWSTDFDAAAQRCAR